MIGHEVVGGFEHARRRRRRNVDCERSVVRDRLDTARGLGRHSLLRRCRLEWASGACRLRNRDWRGHGHRCGCSRRRGARRLRFNGRRRRFRHSSRLGRSGRRFGRRGRLGRDRRGRGLGCSSRRRRLFGNSLFRGGSDVAGRSDRRRHGLDCRARRLLDRRRQEEERVDVTLRVARDAQPEVHERLRAGCPDDRTLCHRCAARDGDRAEVEERC